MLINTRWLLDYIEPECTHEDLINVLPRVGLEIDEHCDLRKELQAIRIGFVREISPLPGVAGMHACKVEVQRGTIIPIICASEHPIEVGWGVPIATAGVRLPSGKLIASGSFHGSPSEGMICLDGEMGLIATGTGLQVFQDESALGTPLPSLLNINEHLLELNVLPNRPDCLGLIGVAREAAAALGRKVRYPNATNAGPIGQHDSTAAAIPVDLRDAAGCPRYACQLIRNVKVAPSPHWLKSRLLAVGSAPINNVVDITNFVLLEWGQPLHAFDFNQLRGGRIVVRRMEPGESLELLSGKIIDGKLAPLVIADAERPVALAGVMGGRATATDEKTTDVLLEAAHFEPVNIRKTIRSIDIGLGTPGTTSSYRFERGTDPNAMLNGALRRACTLIAELTGGRLAAPPTDIYPTRREPHTITLSAAQVSKCLGLTVEPTTIRDSLRHIEMTCDDQLNVNVPTWRVDVTDPVVLVEDVARQIGYESIPMQAGVTMPTLGRRSTLDRLRQSIAQNLAAAGWLEARNPSLESPESAAVADPRIGGTPIRISNPANREMSMVRNSLLPGLLASAERNLRRGAPSIRLYEIDRVFRLMNDKPDPRQDWTVTAVAAGALHDSDWRAGSARLDFFDLKGVAENLLDAVGAKHRTFQPLEAKPYLPGAAAEIHIDNKPVGRIGELVPGLVDTGKFVARLFAFELDLASLEPCFLTVPMARPIPRTPAITRDLAIVVDKQQPLAPIEAAIRQTAGTALESLRLVDVYVGAQVQPDRKSLAFHFVFRDAERTLTADEVAKTMDEVLAALTKQFEAVLRA